MLIIKLFLKFSIWETKCFLHGNKVFHAEKQSVSQLMTMLKHFFDGVKKPLILSILGVTLCMTFVTLNVIVEPIDIQWVTKKMTRWRYFYRFLSEKKSCGTSTRPSGQLSTIALRKKGIIFGVFDNYTYVCHDNSHD